MHAKEPIYYKIEESLKDKSREELIDMHIKLNPKWRKDWKDMSDIELMEDIALTIYQVVRRREPKREFNLERYFKTLYKGKQKGRAYKSYREH